MEQLNRTILFKYIYAKNVVKTGRLQIKVISDCMLPLIDVNDVIEIIECHKYRKGDIVAIFMDNQIYIHRIISIKKDTVTTKGDRTFNRDMEVGVDRIIGILERNVSKNKMIARRRIVSAVIAYISGLESMIFRNMKNDINQKKLRYIFGLRRIVDKLNKYCIH